MDAGMDARIAQFTVFTGASAETAAQYLHLSDGEVENAIQLYFENPDLGGAPASATQPTNMNGPESGGQSAPITIDSDEEDDLDDPTDQQYAGAGQRQPGASLESDEEMARRLQEEFYGAGGAQGGGGNGRSDDIRAPIARTTEQLVGPGSSWDADDGEVQAAVAHQMIMRERARARGAAGRPGIFNQDASIWEQAGSSSDAPEALRQRQLAMATGGASEASAKSNMLAELFRPPFDLMYHGSWDSARDTGKLDEKWLLVNVQDPSIFDCQVLNRDIWKNDSIRETVRESFVFMQFNKDDPRGQDYVSYYFQTHESQDAYPHIAIVDPRTGEQVKIWSGRPVPQAVDFLMQLHEFLDRYSLKITAKNPVAKRKSEKKQVDVNRMSEEEMMALAVANSLNKNAASDSTDHDPDALTRSGILTQDKGKAPAKESDSGAATPDTAMGDTGTLDNIPTSNSKFSQISSSDPHQEPPNDPAATTRIQFRHPNGRVVRRFALNDPVRRLYEWLKAEPLESKQGQAFELVAMGKNLIDSLDLTVADAGLKMGTIMVEFVSGDDE